MVNLGSTQGLVKNKYIFESTTLTWDKGKGNTLKYGGTDRHK